jgi:hypothetical protein
MAELPNTPLPDELAQIRQEIKRLEAREAELRQILIDNPDVREGAAYYAEIKVTTQNRTDLKEMRAMYPDIVEQFTFSADIVRIVLSQISEDGELTPVRRTQRSKVI